MSPLPPVAIDAIEGCKKPCRQDPRGKKNDNDQVHDVRRGPSSTGHGPSAGTRRDPHAPAQSRRHDASALEKRTDLLEVPVRYSIRRRLAVGTRQGHKNSKQEKPETTRTGPGSRAAGVGVERTQLARSDGRLQSLDGAPVSNLSTPPPSTPIARY
ncbi:hypothetical protein CEP52_005048 [Fusarium oligoseptatum]|uniref:Uncharacterized protein n=1 Tax=Fusarium oligoseptatum TaxID=2604345 RepID=A0A428U0F8_9HYPO|nr:hypothetical protein CEP52_005048 [Fusarium oligoseptatum]